MVQAVHGVLAGSGPSAHDLRAAAYRRSDKAHIGDPDSHEDTGRPRPGHNWPVRVSIVGLGLIGGSIARALHERNGPGRWHVTAWSRSEAPVRKALADGAIDVAAGTLEEAVRDAEMVILAAPPLTCLDLVDQLSGPMRGAVSEDCTVTDVASAKARIVARADAAGLPFIGGHPMAGSEASGYGAAIPDLFVDRPWVTVIGRYARLCDGERIGELVEACGAIQVPMEAVAHDNAVAAISHMPLIVSAAVAAAGWAGITRLARGDPTMGAGIAATNSAAIAVRLRDVRAAIDEWIAELEREGGPDSEALLARFTSARRRLVDSQRE